MTLELIIALILFALVSSITPGPNNIMLLASGANFGFRRTLPHMFGIMLGFGVMIFCVGIVLIQIFDAHPIIYTLLRVVSVGYLIFLAYKVATAAPPEAETKTQDKIARRNKHKPFSFMQAALFQWVNPKAVGMAVIAISTYTPPARPWQSVLWVSVIFALVNLPSISVWVVLGVQARRWLNAPRRLRIFNVTAAMLLLLSLYPILFTE